MTANRRRTLVGWTLALAVVTLAPLAMLADAVGAAGPMMAMVDATGVVATSTLLGTIVLSARLRSLTTTLGIERVTAAHRYLGGVTLAAVVVHVALILVDRPANWTLLVPLTGTAASRAALVGVLALLVLATSSALRRRRYERWQRLHQLATAAAVAGTVLHVVWLSHLVRDRLMGPWFAAAVTALLVVVLYRWLWRPARASAAYTVRDVRHESDDVSTIILGRSGGRHHAGPRTLEFEPGQFAWLRLGRFGAQEHPYSMSGTAHGASTLEFTVRHTGDFTDQLAELAPGRRVYLDGPHGAFTPSADAPGLVFIGAGVGMTPILSILRTLADRGDRRPHRLVVAAGSPDALMFGDEVAGLRKRLQLEVLTVVRRPGRGYRGAVGAVDGPKLAGFLPGPPVRGQLVYYVCGPSVLIADALAALQILRVPRERVMTERFDPNLPRPHGGHREQRPLAGADGRTGRHARRPADGGELGRGGPDADSGRHAAVGGGRSGRSAGA